MCHRHGSYHTEYTACAVCFFLSRHSAHATYRAVTTWSAQPVPYGLSCQTQCTRHRQGSYHMECKASAISVFCPDTVHVHTYRAPTTWSARPLPYGFSECTRPIQGTYHIDCKAMGFLSSEYTHHIQGCYHKDCKAMGFLSREYTHHIQGSYHMDCKAMGFLSREYTHHKIIIIIKRISRTPIYHTRWQHRALYNNINHTHTHARTHARTRARTHTHTECRMRGWAGL